MIGIDICFETLFENTVIYSCMYIRKVLLDQQPIFLIVLGLTSFREEPQSYVIMPVALARLNSFHSYLRDKFKYPKIWIIGKTKPLGYRPRTVVGFMFTSCNAAGSTLYRSEFVLVHPLNTGIRLGGDLTCSNIGVITK